MTLNKTTAAVCSALVTTAVLAATPQAASASGNSCVLRSSSGQGTCVDVKDAEAAEGASLQLLTCTGGDNQRWLRSGTAAPDFSRDPNTGNPGGYGPGGAGSGGTGGNRDIWIW